MRFTGSLRARSIATSMWPCRASARCVPYLDAYWRERVEVQQLERLDLSLTSYPPTAPLERPARLAARRTGRPAAISRCCRRRRSTRSARASPSSTASGARRRCSPRTWRRRSAARSTTGSPRNGSTATRACAPRSWCRRRTPSSPPRRSSAAPSDQRFVQVLVLAGLDMPLGRRLYWPIYRGRAKSTTCRSASMPAALSPSAERQRLALLSARGLRREHASSSRRSSRASCPRACSRSSRRLKVVLIESG